MRVFVQWTKAHPDGWEEIDVRNSVRGRRALTRLTRKPAPRGGEEVDDDPGWVYDLNVQGVSFAGHDHYAVRPTEDGVQVTVWNDDPDDYPPGERYAQVWTFHPLRADPRYGGEVNTNQHLVVYDERKPSAWEGHRTTGGPVVVRPWDDFTPPQNPWHGIWVPDSLAAEHQRSRPTRGWRDE